MPTTTIETPLSNDAFERRVAKQLSLWWRRQGLDIRHAITKFVVLRANRVYSGPFPMSGPPDEPAAAFAFVSCVVSRHRGHEFRRQYAHVVRVTLGPEIPADRVFVSFYPTEPADHFTPGASTWGDERDAKEEETR